MGQKRKTIIGNTTLTELTNGTHTLVVYAEDVAGKIGASQPVTFNVGKLTYQIQEHKPKEQSLAPSIPFPITWITPIVVSVAAVITVLMLFLRKRKDSQKQEKTSALY